MIRKTAIESILNVHRSEDLFRAIAGNTTDLRHLEAEGVVTAEYDDDNVRTLKLNQNAFEKWIEE